MSRLVVSGLIASLLVLTASLAAAYVPDPPHSTVAWTADSHYFNSACTFPDICPKGDSVGPAGHKYLATVDVIVHDQFGAPMAGIGANEIDAEGTCLLGGGSPCTQVLLVIANSPTDGTGHTTITVNKAGGCCTDLAIVARGIRLNTLTYRSMDYTADLAANLSDLGFLADTYNKSTNLCFDFNCDGIVNLSDLGIFADHYNHVCV